MGVLRCSTRASAAAVILAISLSNSTANRIRSLVQEHDSGLPPASEIDSDGDGWRTEDDTNDANREIGIDFHVTENCNSCYQGDILLPPVSPTDKVTSLLQAGSQRLQCCCKPGPCDHVGSVDGVLRTEHIDENGEYRCCKLTEKCGWWFSGYSTPSADWNCPAREAPLFEPVDPSTIKMRPWPNRTVWYRWKPGINEEIKATLLVAMEIWQSRSCLRFQEVEEYHLCDDQTSDMAPWCYPVNMGSDEEGCNSHAGYWGAPWQKLNLQTKGCNHMGIALHELGHTVGLSHEHERFDRDQYIKVALENVEKTENERWFDVNPWRNRALRHIPYDLSSIMHYGEGAFAWRGTKTISVIGRDAWGNCKVGQRQMLSMGDILTVRDLYDCSDTYCVDRHRSCSRFSCDSVRVDKSWMRAHCPATCGLCTCEDLADLEGIEGDGANSTARCQDYVAQGLCPHQREGTTPGLRAWMRANCAKSCGICGPSGISCKDTSQSCTVQSCTTLQGITGCQRTCGMCAAEVFCRSSGR
eukprot:TRINITY_DN6246_c0_g1_i4.p1 TRINITY_DN6246_c0_g1~~TRINITY_DN6246_c0_g1_i4.p1  ORF type:complete len:527 (+),score=33.79 TRINITY_DN6246_c0_g1_i4:81-1661(+)